MDTDTAREAFLAYVSAYDASNPRIALKVRHTLRVARLCARIAGELGLPPQEVDLAWICGLLHDIGRFEQVRRFDTFNDARSVSHAALGVEVLFAPDDDGRPLLRRFVQDDSCDDLLRTAVGTHSALRLPEGLDHRTLTHCQILRDADKIDILRVNCESPVEDVYGLSEREMRASQVSDACVRAFYEHRCLPRDIRRHPADILLGHLCFAWELVYPASLAIVREQGHLRQMSQRHWDRPDTQEAFDAMATHLCEQLGL